MEAFNVKKIFGSDDERLLYWIDYLPQLLQTSSSVKNKPMLKKKLICYFIESIYKPNFVTQVFNSIGIMLIAGVKINKACLDAFLSVFPGIFNDSFNDPCKIMTDYTLKFAYSTQSSVTRLNYIYLLKKISESKVECNERDLHCLMTIFYMVFDKELNPALLYLSLDIFKSFIISFKLMSYKDTSVYSKILSCIRSYFPLNPFILPQSNFTIPYLGLSLALVEFLGQYDVLYVSDYDEILVDEVISYNDDSRYCAIRLLFLFLKNNALFDTEILVKLHLKLISFGCKSSLNISKVEKYNRRKLIKLIFGKMASTYSLLDFDHNLTPGIPSIIKPGYKQNLINFLLSIDITTKTSVKVVKYMSFFTPNIFNTQTLNMLEFHLFEIEKDEKCDLNKAKTVWLLFLVSKSVNIESSFAERIKKTVMKIAYEFSDDKYLSKILKDNSMRKYENKQIKIENFECPSFVTQHKEMSTYFYHKAFLHLMSDYSLFEEKQPPKTSDTERQCYERAKYQQQVSYNLESIDNIIKNCEKSYLLEYFTTKNSQCFKTLALFNPLLLARYFDEYLELAKEAVDQDKLEMYIATTVLIMQMVSHNPNVIKCVDLMKTKTFIWRFCEFYLRTFEKFNECELHEPLDMNAISLFESIRGKFDKFFWAFDKTANQQVEGGEIFIDYFSDTVFEMVKNCAEDGIYFDTSLLVYTLLRLRHVLESKRDETAKFVLSYIVNCMEDPPKKLKNVIWLLHHVKWLINYMKPYVDILIGELFDKLQKFYESVTFMEKKTYLNAIIFSVVHKILDHRHLSNHQKLSYKLREDSDVEVRILASHCVFDKK